MTPLSGPVGIDFALAATVASPSLSPQWPALIHQFDDRHGDVPDARRWEAMFVVTARRPDFGPPGQAFDGKRPMRVLERIVGK